MVMPKMSSEMIRLGMAVESGLVPELKTRLDLVVPGSDLPVN